MGDEHPATSETYALIKTQLQSPSRVEQVQGAKMLATCSIDEAASLLQLVLEEQDQDILSTICDHLVARHSPESLAIVSRALASAHCYSSQVSIETRKLVLRNALIELLAVATDVQLVALMQSPDVLVRCALSRMLATQHTELSCRLLVQALDDQHPAVVSEAVVALTRRSDRPNGNRLLRAIERIQEQSREDSTSFSEGGVYATLAAYNHIATDEDLLTAVKEGTPFAQRAAALLLGKRDARVAIPAIQAAMAASDENSRRAFATALGMMGGSE